MKKTVIRRIISFSFVLIFLLSLCPVSSFAAEDKIVARVSFFCVVKSPGHCWIYVENLTDNTYKVGAYTLGGKQGVSIGTFGPSRYDGKGIYYNVESYCQTVYGLDGFSTLTEEITLQELEALSDGVKNYKNNWSAFRNCVTFAAKMWNIISDKKLSNLIIPAFTNLQLTFKGCRKNDVVQKSVTADKVYRQRGNGNSAYLDNVCKASLGNLW